MQKVPAKKHDLLAYKNFSAAFPALFCYTIDRHVIQFRRHDYFLALFQFAHNVAESRRNEVNKLRIRFK